MIDLAELRARIAEKATKGIHVAPVVLELIDALDIEQEVNRGLRALLAEVDTLRREVAQERAAVVAWLRREIQKCGCDDDTAACIERGEHRREEER
jgi:hypothetical protein